MDKPTKPSRSSSPRYHRASGAGMSSSEIEGFQRDGTRRTNRRQQDRCDCERLCREKEAATSCQTSTFNDLQDPLCNSRCKRTRNSFQEVESSRHRVPLVEIRRDSWGDASCATSAKYGLPTPTTRGDRAQPALHTNTYKNGTNIYATRHPRRSAAARLWDRPDSNNTQTNSAHQSNLKPLAQHNCFETGLHDSLDEQALVKVSAQAACREQGAHAHLSNRIRESHLFYTDTASKQCQRRRVWEFACALAHEYLNRKRSREGDRAGQADAATREEDTGEKRLSKEGWETEEKTGCSGYREEIEIRSEARAVGGEEQGEQGQHEKLVPSWRAVCMDDVVNPMQAAAAAWL